MMYGYEQIGSDKLGKISSVIKSLESIVYPGIKYLYIRILKQFTAVKDNLQVQVTLVISFGLSSGIVSAMSGIKYYYLVIDVLYKIHPDIYHTVIIILKLTSEYYVTEKPDQSLICIRIVIHLYLKYSLSGVIDLDILIKLRIVTFKLKLRHTSYDVFKYIDIGSTDTRRYRKL